MASNIWNFFDECNLKLKENMAICKVCNLEVSRGDINK